MSAPATRSDVYSLDGDRQFAVSYPADVTPEEAGDFSAWLQLVAKKVARQAAPVVSEKPPIVSPKEPTCSRCPAFLSDTESLRLGVCAGCRSPGPTQVISGPPSHEVGGTLPAPRVKAPEVAPKGKAESPDGSNIPSARRKLREVLAQAPGPMTCSELAKATQIAYQTAYANLTNCPEFEKSPSGKWRLATLTTSESEAESDGREGGSPEIEPPSATPTAPDDE